MLGSIAKQSGLQSRQVEDFSPSPQLAVNVMFMSKVRRIRWETCEIGICSWLLPAIFKLLICQSSQLPAFEHLEPSLQGNFFVLLGL